MKKEHKTGHCAKRVTLRLSLTSKEKKESLQVPLSQTMAIPMRKHYLLAVNRSSGVIGRGDFGHVMMVVNDTWRYGEI